MQTPSLFGPPCEASPCNVPVRLKSVLKCVILLYGCYFILFNNLWWYFGRAATEGWVAAQRLAQARSGILGHPFNGQRKQYRQHEREVQPGALGNDLGQIGMPKLAVSERGWK